MNRVLIILGVLFITQVCHGDTFSHESWDNLLKIHVVELGSGATAVNYQAMSQQKNQLKDYLKKLSEVSQAGFDSWSKPQQLAFLINAYNAWTIQFILTRYPDLKSIKDLGSFFKSPWNKSFIPLLGSERTLNDIEHALIRGSGRYNEPRIHFAVNCASIGCPPLRAEAYVGERLETQLNEQTQLFLSDPSRNRLNGDALEVSSIFKWYQEDFEHGWQGIDSLSALFSQHAQSLNLSVLDVKRLHSGDIDIEFLDYDWQLNDTE